VAKIGFLYLVLLVHNRFIGSGVVLLHAGLDVQMALYCTTDGIYSMLPLANGICTRMHNCIGSALEHQPPGLPNTFKHAGI